MTELIRRSSTDRRKGTLAMSLTRIHNLSISLDGSGTVEGQSHDAHFGQAGGRLRRNRGVDYDPGR
jgi:hypothetical protein